MTITFLFEGVDGSGKSTLIKRLRNRLKEEGYSVLSLAFPSPDLKSELKRFSSMRLKEQYKVLDALESEFRWGVKAIKLRRPDIVLIDRFVISTVVYQQTKFLTADTLRERFYDLAFSLPRLHIVFTFNRFRRKDELFNDAFLSEVYARYKVEYVYWMFRSKDIKTKALWTVEDYEKFLERVIEYIKRIKGKEKG